MKNVFTPTTSKLKIQLNWWRKRTLPDDTNRGSFNFDLYQKYLKEILPK